MKTVFELALEYVSAVAALGSIYQAQDRTEVPELWVAHDTAYKALWEASQNLPMLELYREACKVAQKASLKGQCSIYVVAELSNTWPHHVERYRVLDWFTSGSTVAEFNSGELQG